MSEMSEMKAHAHITPGTVFSGDPRPHVTLPRSTLFPMLPSQPDYLMRFLTKIRRDIGEDRTSTLTEAVSQWAFRVVLSPLLDEHPESEVIDIGCGTGRDLQRIKESYPDTITDGVVPYCGTKFLEFDQNLLPQTMTGRYTLLLASHVLEHSPIPYFTLTEYNRIMKKGGFAYVELPQPHQEWSEGNANHYSVMGSEMWEELFRRSCFDIQQKWDIETSDGLYKFWAYLLMKIKDWD